MGLRDTLRAWAQLLRLPNLFTVPGDPLAGFAVATAGLAAAASPAAPAIAAASSCLLYWGGLVLNDLLDLEEDRRERPQRPLPSGRIRTSTAFLAVIALFTLGVGITRPLGPKVSTAAAGLALLILMYNSSLRRVPALGPLLMGLCRAASFFLGVVAGYAAKQSAAAPILVGFETHLVYIAGITLLARLETTGRNPRLAAYLPAVALMAGACALAWTLRPASVAGWIGLLLSAVCGVGLALDAARCMGRAGKVLPPMIGQLISALVFWQGALLFAAGRGAWALAVLACWPLSRALARRFYQS